MKEILEVLSESKKSLTLTEVILKAKKIDGRLEKARERYRVY